MARNNKWWASGFAGCGLWAVGVIGRSLSVIRCAVPVRRAAGGGMMVGASRSLCTRSGVCSKNIYGGSNGRPWAVPKLRLIGGGVGLFAGLQGLRAEGPPECFESKGANGPSNSCPTVD